MKKRKERAGIYFAVFLLFMLICTIVSRGIYAYQMPKVTLGSMEERTLLHNIEEYGTVFTKEEVPVVTEEGLLVKKVSVVEGQKVAKGDTFFEIELEDLQDILEETKMQIQIEEAKQNDAKSTETTAVNRAEQDFKDATAAADAEVNQANSEYQEAQAKLNAFPSEEEYKKAGCKNDAEYQKLQKAAKKKNATAEEKDAFAAYKKSVEEQLEENYKQEKAALETAVSEKEKAVNAANASRSESLKQAQRTLEDAKKSSEANLDLEQQNQIALLKEKREMLQNLQQAQGKILSEIDGYISSISIRAGERTTDTSALVISDENGKKLFQAVVPQEEKAYVNMGDTMELSFDSGKKQLHGVTIEAVGESADGNCQITGKIEDADIKIGDSGKMTIQKDTGRYACGIPLSALYTDNGSNYVLLVEARKTILGTELIAKKRKVKVLEKDEEYAALEDDSVTEEEQLVISTDKTIKDGTRVRLVEE